ncbi:Rne/Rng family ribonuclease [Bacillota bacterium LX-D]|nr:Rne/Rng family ribonuclease [Bacillota bacterium LX-D]
MFKEIVIQANPLETVAAVLEDHRLAEIYFERSMEQRLVGNIYRGKVENVLPGMQAAFIDIGLEKNAFLYVEDAFPAKPEGGHKEVEKQQPNIGDLLKKGQTLIVQVTKEPQGTKGPRVTTNITLPGRYLVLMPMLDYIGISRRITDETERNRLKKIAQDLDRGNIGVIVRTIAQGYSEEELKDDFNSLFQTWLKIKSKMQSLAAPVLIHSDLELMQRLLRDILTEDTDRIVVNSRNTYLKTLDYAETLAPNLKHKIMLKETEELLAEYQIPLQIEQALKRKIWLNCGGYLIIEHVEALTVIDVNTGKYVGSTTLADTVFRTNIDAAVEIARQLRLRDIGGIVIIDFIDMSNEGHRSLVLETLEKELKKDRTKTHILGLTQLGLVELTRKKVRQEISNILQKDCPYCRGRGKVLSEETISLEARRQIAAFAALTTAPIIKVKVHPAVAALLVGEEGRLLAQLQEQTGKKIIVFGFSSIHLEDVKLERKQQLDPLENIWPVKIGEILTVEIESDSNAGKQDGVVMLDGHEVQVKGSSEYMGQYVPIQITHVGSVSAKAKVIGR